MSKSNKKYYAWIGQSASCGTPNILTGRMSMFGTDYVFANKKTRNQFVDDYYDQNGNKFAEKCTKQQLRSKNLGSTVANWELDLLHREIDAPVFDKKDGWS